MKGRPGMFLLSEEALLCQVLRKKKLHVKRPDLHSYFYIQLIKSQGGEAIHFFHFSRSSSPFVWIPGLPCILNSYCARKSPVRQSDLWVNSANEQVCTILQCFLVSLEPTSALLNGVFPRIFTSRSDYTGEIIFERKSKAEELTSHCC